MRREGAGEEEQEDDSSEWPCFVYMSGVVAIDRREKIRQIQPNQAESVKAHANQSSHLFQERVREKTIERKRKHLTDRRTTD